MCGIAGISLTKGMVQPTLLQGMAKRMVHRGPDGEGIFTFLNMGLAHRRLAILDLAGGQQPLRTESDTAPVAAVVNGEIYNYKILQAGLRDDGVALATHSDSEPVLHLVMREGEAAWEKLSGMYAAAVADGRSGTLWLGVDPFGIKPLYYAETPKGLAFASEPQVLVQSGWVRAEVNREVLPSLLNRHFCAGDATLFTGVKKMLPGERLCVKDGRIIKRWRQLPRLAPALPSMDLDSALAAFETRFTAAIERHLQSDVPYGVLLSGGLDSSTIVLTMAKLGVPIHAYTARFAKAGDEDTAAAQLAASVGAKHTTVTYDADDFWQALPKLAMYMDDLTTDYSSLPLLKLMERARQDVTILLSGEGGDELLAGYRGYRQSPLQAWWKGLRKGDAVPFRGLFRNGAMASAPKDGGVPWNMRGFSRLQRRQSADLAQWLPQDLLLRLDRISMAHSIEGRVPFLDDDFAAWAFALPDTLKVGTPDGGKPMGKWLLRQWLARQGHSDLAFGKKKGFSVPVGDYLALRRDEVAAIWAESPLLQELLKPKAADVLLGRLGHAKAANLAFSLTLLGLWERGHLS
ncbi:MAG: asparagine synthase (glutamine-hydrolyzing) [Pseudomonadaceae bacterium]|nr:asparagine synthase (glutamine-hydrolyzing) [Pseudomonadaceae bacterium]